MIDVSLLLTCAKPRFHGTSVLMTTQTLLVSCKHMIKVPDASIQSEWTWMVFYF